VKKVKAEILVLPHQIEKLLELVERTRKEIMIVVPFYEKLEIEEILKSLSKNVKLRALTRADIDSDVEALERLCKKGEVRAVPNLHAKILIFDRSIAIVSSLNLDSSWERGSLDVGVLIRGKVCKKLVDIFNKWWEGGGRVTQEGIEQLKKAQKRSKTAVRIPIQKTRFALGKRIAVQVFKPTICEERDLILNINWNPHNFTRACTLKEAENNICCNQRRQCLKEGWIKDGGCTSSYLFKDFEYATRKSAIKKGRLAFFIAKNPNLKNEYYIVGFLFMKSGRRGRRAWGKTLYLFLGDRKKSIKFPSSGNKVIRLDKSLKKKFASRRNPQYIPRANSMSILEEYLQKTRDRKAKKILKILGGTRR
jgi:hypothetical protein